MAWTSPRTWVAGETVTASIGNTHWRDQFKAIGDAWTSYTPTWTGSGGNPAIGNGTLAGKYIQAGKLVVFQITIIAGSTTTFGTGNYGTSLPFAPTAYRWRFYGTVGNSGITDVWACARSAGGGSTAVELTHASVSASTVVDAFITPTVPHTMGTADYIYIHGTYEAA